MSSGAPLALAPLAGAGIEQCEELHQGRLEFARCMRDERFDVPDPQPGVDPDGGGGPLGGLDLDNCQPAASRLTDE